MSGLDCRSPKPRKAGPGKATCPLFQVAHGILVLEKTTPVRTADGGRMRIRGTELVRGIAEGATELVWPTRCVGCDMPGELVCDECRDGLPWICQRWACPTCGAPFGHLTCTECGRDWETRAVVCAMGFEGTAARMVTCLKDAHELRLASVMAMAMLTALEEASAWSGTDGQPRYDPAIVDAVCFVPATSAAFSRRGFDHMDLVSRALCAETGLSLHDVLVREHARDQRILGREERSANLGGSMRVTDEVAGMRLLLLDDVVTTGASVREATRTLLSRGALSVTACALARVW